jgi:hypothetical protein
MNPTDLLTTLAQLGVALAGFSGIVSVLGTRASGEWSSWERTLLAVLLATSGGVILWSLLPLLLLASGLAEGRVWRLSSASWVVAQVAVLSHRVRQVVRDRDTRTQGGVLVIAAFLGGVSALVVQAVNVWLAVAWPHLAAVTWYLLLSFLVFVLLLQPPRS